MLRKPLTPIEDDTEEAPWMVMGMSQSNAASVFFVSLRTELQSRADPPLVAMMLPIRHHPIPGGDVETLSPDILVAAVPPYIRPSYEVEEEGVAPAFVLEVISPASQVRDLVVKPQRYERMGVREYALFAPETPEGRILVQPQLQGYTANPISGEYVPWEPDQAGRLYSDVLGLWLVLRHGELRAQRIDGTLVLTQAEAVAAWEKEMQAREQEQLLRRQEERLRIEAEAEVARLRAELERHRQE